VVILNFTLTAIVVAVVLIGGTLLAARVQFEQPGAFAEAHTIIVRPGADADDIADALQREGLGNRWVFIAGVRISGAANRLQAGEYLVPGNASLSDIMEQMIEGRVVEGRITIPEGFTSHQVVDCLSADTAFTGGYTGGLTATQIANCARDVTGLTGTIATVPPEGTLLPETYKFGKGDSRQSVIDRMMRDQARVVADVWSRRAADLPLKTPKELVTLASIIEKEASRADERTRVAAVFINRLRINMKLDADPTVIYAIYKGAAPPPGYRLSSADKEVASPYNTYASPGLPPGPISNPGRASLEAAADPSRTRDLYFVSDGTSDAHVFAETFEEHQRNVARYRAAGDAVVPAAAPAPTTTQAAVPAVGGPAGSPPAPARPAGTPPAPQPRPATAPGRP
jgi:UPF0755 protein